VKGTPIDNDNLFLLGRCQKNHSHILQHHDRFERKNKSTNRNPSPSNSISDVNDAMLQSFREPLSILQPHPVNIALFRIELDGSQKDNDPDIQTSWHHALKDQQRSRRKTNKDRERGEKNKKKKKKKKKIRQKSDKPVRRRETPIVEQQTDETFKNIGCIPAQRDRCICSKQRYL
jgi:hypothetical protein